MTDNSPTTRNGDECTDAWPGDVHSATATEYASVTLNTDLLRLELDNSDADIGFEVLRDGQSIGVSAGILSPNDEPPRVHSYHALTLEEARSFHAALGEAIDDAEDAAECSESEPDRKTLLQQLKEAV